MSKRLLPLIPTGLVVDTVRPDAERLTILTHPRAAASACPTCGRSSARLHSRYTRVLADLPWQGQRVAITVRARRWRCADQTCPRHIFAERLPSVAPPRARRTRRLGDLQRHLALALGGEGGARLPGRLSVPVSGDTLLRVLRCDAPADPTQAPRVLGVDDWAWRRGQRYGTILVDLERHRVVDLLPDREAVTLADWLHRHPGAEIVARDRTGAYADGARRGAPGAIQVADRFHLLCNASQALLQVLDRHRSALARIARTLMPDDADAVLMPKPKPPTQAEQRCRHGQEARERRFQHVAALARAGHSIYAIVRETGLARNTMRRWLRAGAAPTWLKGERTRITDAFRPHFVRRFGEGEHNAIALWRELRVLGFGDGIMTVRALVARLRKGSPTAASRRLVTPGWRPPSSRTATRLLLADKGPSELEGSFLALLRETIPEIDRATTEVRAFAALVRERDTAALDAWLDDCRGGPIRGLVEGLRRARAAVEAALALPWSTSPVEGQINRLKMFKRAMYGRAKLDLLRARVLAA